MTLPTISVVVVNLNGCAYLEPCFTSLLNQDYPPEQIELILLDNASHDDSLALMASRFPSVKVIANSENVGFSPAVNQGAAAAHGDYLVLMNNDAHADPGCLRELVATLERHRERGAVCVGAKMLDWEGRTIDFAGGGLSFYGHGYQFCHRLPANAVGAGEDDMLFACGGAMLVDRALFLQLGGFDESYFAYFEDVDFGWRLWLAGYRVVFAPAAVVYHRHHGASKNVPSHRINALFERNALMTIIKNYDDMNLSRLLGPTLLMLVQRLIAYSDNEYDQPEIEWDSFAIGNSAPSSTAAPPADQPVAISKMTLSYLVGLRNVMQQLPALLAKRQQVQAIRKRPDCDILPLFRYLMGPHSCCDLVPSRSLIDMPGLRELFAGVRMHRILVISTDPLYENLAGPGIRSVEMARHLAQSCEVVLASPRRADVAIPGVTCVAFEHDDHEGFESLVDQAEVVVVQGFTLYRHPVIEQKRKIIVVDLYDPFHLENLEYFKHSDIEHARALLSNHVQIINQQLRLGDFFICASERQRDFWLGALSSMGRLTPENYAADPTFHTLIDVVSFGVDPNPPVHQHQVLKGVFQNIQPDDIVVLWGGGIWDWLDPLTVVRAVAIARREQPRLKLFFMGYHHPNPVDVPKMKIYEQVTALVEDLDLAEAVCFNDRWVPYHERSSYFLEADIGVSTHLGHIETRYAFRTRLLDYIWAGLPMVVSEGDALAEVVAREGLGHVVEIGDAEGFARALLSLANQPEARSAYAPAFERVRQAFVWPEVLKPLIAFCQNPRCAADRGRLTLVDTYERRIEELEEIIARKNDHILSLEDLLRKIESGRVMRLLRRLRR